MLCPESQTSDKINPRPTELTFCFPCLLKRAVRFALQTPRLSPKKTFDFHLCAENVTAAEAVLSPQTQRDLGQQGGWLITSLLSDKSIKPLQIQPHRSPWGWEHRQGPSAQWKTSEAQGQRKAAEKQEMHTDFHRKCPVCSTPLNRKVVPVGHERRRLHSVQDQAKEELIY